LVTKREQLIEFRGQLNWHVKREDNWQNQSGVNKSWR